MKSLKLLMGLLGLVGFINFGCSNDTPTFSLMADSDTFVQGKTFNNKLDVLFVINDEPSMSSFQDELVQSFASFIQLFTQKGYDFKIGIVTTSAYMADPTLNGYDSADEAEADFNDFNGTVNSGVYVITPDTPDLLNVFAINAKPDKNTAGQDGRAFSSFRQALLNARPANAGFLRPDSFLAVVLVDNQDDFSGNDRCVGCNNSGRYNAPTLDPVSDYVQFLDTLTGTSGPTARYNVSAMTQSAAPCQAGSNMVRIMELAELTNGVIGDICEPDFGPSMVQMADQIATLSTQFFLDRLPIVESISVSVNGVPVAMDVDNGWSYDSAANSVLFHGSAIPAQGAVISVDFDPAQFD